MGALRFKLLKIKLCFLKKWNIKIFLETEIFMTIINNHSMIIK